MYQSVHLLLPAPEQQHKHEDLLLYLLPLVPDGLMPPAQVEALRPEPGQGQVWSGGQQGVDSGPHSQGGQGVAPGQKQSI